MSGERDQKLYKAAYWIASVITGLILLSAYQKILYPEAFSLSVYRFRLLPDALVNGFALYLSWLEMTCACCLLFVPRWRVAALWIVLFLFSLFTIGIIINLLRGTTFGCGCFSTSPLARPMSWLSVLRNSGLILLVIMTLVAHRKAYGSRH